MQKVLVVLGIAAVLCVSCATGARKASFAPPAEPEEEIRKGTLGEPDALERFSPVELPADHPLCLTVRTGQLLRLPLAENGTTGYLWSVENANQRVLELVSSDFLLPKHAKGMAGVGGVRVFTFRAVAPGCASLAFRHARPWEKDPAAPCHQVVVLVCEEE